jgi:hypothetical protein
MDVPPEVVEQAALFLGTIALGAVALLIGAYLGHFIGGLLEDWI